MRVVVAGATGFVGRALVERLAPHAQVVGLSRSEREGTGTISYLRCDLFSLLEAERALSGADVAVYLVHSMMPQARLTQGSFQDLDLLLADNFARAAKQAGVKRIVYLGGLVPEPTGHALSPHIESRLEVERALSAYGVPVVALRAGIILGPGGSSSDMIVRLVRRLPVMLCPKWTSTLGQPVALEDVLRVLERVVLDQTLPPGAYDLGGPDRLSYIDLMALTANRLGLKRKFLPLSLFSVHLSLLWLRLVTGAPRQLVAPLVESLRDPMLAKDHLLFERYGLRPTPVREALDESLASHVNSPSRLLEMKRGPLRSPENRVFSVQRMVLAKDESAEELAQRYARFVVSHLHPGLHVEVDALGSLRFYVAMAGEHKPLLLELTRAPERCTLDRQLFYITGGLLVDRRAPRGRFELRRVAGRMEVIAAVYDFVPALPWRIYQLTQAPLHLWVMRGFGRHLAHATPLESAAG